jgi:hypothetical protein
MITAAEAAAIRDDQASTRPQRQYWYTHLVRWPAWCAAYHRARAQRLEAFPDGHDAWKVCAPGVLVGLRPGRIYRVRAIGLRYRQVACNCPGSHDGRVCLHMALVAEERARTASICLLD